MNNKNQGEKRRINGYYIASFKGQDKTDENTYWAFDNQIPSKERKFLGLGKLVKFQAVWSVDDGEYIKQIPVYSETKKEDVFEELIKHIVEGDKVGGIVKGIDTNGNVFVEIYPNFTALMRRSNAGGKPESYQHKIGRFCMVYIDKIDYANKRIELSYHPNDFNIRFGDNVPCGQLSEWCDIPDRIIEEYKRVTNVFTVTRHEIEEILNESFMQAVADDYILIKENEITFYVKAKKTKAGGPLSAGIKKSSQKKGKEYFVNFIGSSGSLPTHALEMYANLGNWDREMCELSKDLLEEKWSFAEKEDLYILNRYLNYTFYCAKEKGIVKEGEYYAAFNTGLVNKSYEPIYCGFCKAKSGSKKWALKGFFKWGASGTGKEFVEYFGAQAPRRLRLYDKNNLHKLIFDVDKEVLPDFDHLFDGRHISRYPRNFILDACNEYDKAVIEEQYKNIQKTEGAENKSKIYNEISNYIVYGNPSLKKKLMEQVQNKIKDAIVKCEWNYKTAIPVYYHKINDISLLLPLCLIDSNIADVALVVEEKANLYVGHTVLTLEMAYMDARQICRPNSDWLVPEKLRGVDVDELSSSNFEF